MIKTLRKVILFFIIDESPLNIINCFLFKVSDQIENIEHEQIEKAEVDVCKDQINEDSTQNTESYSIAGTINSIIFSPYLKSI